MGDGCESGPVSCCGVMAFHEEAEEVPAGRGEAPWVEDLESLEDLSGPDDAAVSSLDIGATQA
eukprot:10010070-Alexandrium_andersonii.AAC.1